MILIIIYMKKVLNAYYVPSTIRILHWLFLLYNNHRHLLRVSCLLGAVSDDLGILAVNFKSIFICHLVNTYMYRHCVKPFSYILVIVGPHTPATFFHFLVCYNAVGSESQLLKYITLFWPQGLCTCSSISPWVCTAASFTSCRSQPHYHSSSEFFSNYV